MKKMLVAAMATWVAFGAFAGQVYYDTSSGVRDLAQGSAWVGGSLPTADDVAVLAGTGGVVKPGANGSTTVPVALGKVVWPTSGGVVVDLSALSQPTGKVLTWTDGEAPDVSLWQVIGQKGKLTVGRDGKCVRLSAGLCIIVK